MSIISMIRIFRPYIFKLPKVFPLLQYNIHITCKLKFNWAHCYWQITKYWKLTSTQPPFHYQERSCLCILFFFFLGSVDWLIDWLIDFWLCWVFVSVRGLSLVVASGGHASSQCAGLSLPRPLFLWSTGSRRAGSVVVAHGPSCSVACGIFPDQSSNPCPLHWQADSQPLRHQGSPAYAFLFWQLRTSMFPKVKVIFTLISILLTVWS